MLNRTFILFAAVMLVSCGTSNHSGSDSISRDQSAAEINNPAFDAIAQKIEQVTADGTIPSISVAVARGGEIVWMQSFGYADRESGRKATPSTIYPLASISKPLTATGIMRLCNEGRLDISQPVDEFIAPAVLRHTDGSAGEVTVRQLLNHTSGMHNYFKMYYTDEDLEPEDTRTLIDKYGTLITPPGYKYKYSNLGYGILDLIIAEVSGVSFEDYMQEQVFGPLGMHDTFVRIDPDRIDDYATLYGIEQERLPFAHTDTKGAGDVFSTAYDLIQFGLFCLGHTSDSRRQVIPAETVRYMQTASDEHARYSDNCQPYGLGWFFEKRTDGPAAVWHEGGFDGTGTLLKLVPSEDIAVVFLTNETFLVANPVINEFADDIIRMYAPGYQPVSCPVEHMSDYTPSDMFLGSWEGKLYSHSDTLDVSMEFRQNGDIEIAYMNHQMYSAVHNQPVYCRTFVSYPSQYENHLSGFVFGSMVHADDLDDIPHHIMLELYRDADMLKGVAMVIPTNTIREKLAIDYYIELNKRE